MCISFVSSEIYDDCNIYGICEDIITTGNITTYQNNTYNNITNFVGGNATFNQTLTDGLYIFQSEEGNLNVNSTTWWAGLTNWVSGWFFSVGNELQFNETKLNASIDARSSSAGNVSWNQTMANDLYLKLDTSNNPLTGDLNITHPGNHSKINLHSTSSYGTALTFNNDGAGQWSLRVPFASNDIGFYSYEDGIASFYLDSATSKGYFVRDLLVGDDFEVGDNVYINGTTWIYESLNVSENVTATAFIGDGSYLTGITGGNVSFNQTLTDSIYSDIKWGYNMTYSGSTYNATYDANNGNVSFNQTLTDSIYSDIKWGYNQTEAVTPNSTQMDYSDGNLNIKESWLTTLWNAIFGTKTTDDLTEGSTNLYNNQSWNETRADLLYSPIGTGGNASFNQTLTNGLYISDGSDNLFGTLRGFTTASYNGNLSNDTMIGYIRGNKLCAEEFTGSHFCLEVEIIKNNILNTTVTGQYWTAKGAPGFTAAANDCEGWTKTSGELGPFWDFNENAGVGAGKLTTCLSELQLSCCGGTA